MGRFGRKSGGAKSAGENKMSIQMASGLGAGNEGGADGDEEVAEFSVKQVAANRYLHNHKLVNEIFSASVVPDVRAFVTVNRLQILKNQVVSLTKHQKRLEVELSTIETRFNAKKIKIQEATQKFERELAAQVQKNHDAQNHQVEARFITRPMYQGPVPIEKMQPEPAAQAEKNEDVEREMEVRQLVEELLERVQLLVPTSEPIYESRPIFLEPIENFHQEPVASVTNERTDPDAEVREIVGELVERVHVTGE